MWLAIGLTLRLEESAEWQREHMEVVGPSLVPPRLPANATSSSVSEYLNKPVCLWVEDQGPQMFDLQTGQVCHKLGNEWGALVDKKVLWEPQLAEQEDQFSCNSL